MADLQVREAQAQSQPLRTDSEAVEQAFNLMETIPLPRTEFEVVSRLRQIKELLRGVRTSLIERRGLDRALIVYALDEPGSSPAAWALMKEIFLQMPHEKGERYNGPLRDRSGHIVERTPLLPPLTEEDFRRLDEYDAHFDTEGGN